MTACRPKPSTLQSLGPKQSFPKIRFNHWHQWCVNTAALHIYRERAKRYFRFLTCPSGSGSDLPVSSTVPTEKLAPLLAWHLPVNSLLQNANHGRRNHYVNKFVWVATLRAWYRLQKPLNPDNTKKILKKIQNPPSRSGPENTKKIPKKYKNGDFWAFLHFSVFFSYFSGPDPGRGFCIFFVIFFVFSGFRGFCNLYQARRVATCGNYLCHCACNTFDQNILPRICVIVIVISCLCFLSLVTCLADGFGVSF